MSPKEHALSQSVLEFLIAQQDWFMLDIAPPPEGSPATSWDRGVDGNAGKWKEGTDGSREGSRVGTPNANAEAGPSTQRGQAGPSKNSQGQAVPASKQASNAQQSQLQPVTQSGSIPQPQPPQLSQSQPILQRQHSTNPGYGSDVDDVMVIPNSDEEYDNDWKLVSQVQGGGVGSGFMAIGAGRGKGEGSKVTYVEKAREKDKGTTKSMRRRTVDRSGEIFYDLSF